MKDTDATYCGKKADQGYLEPTMLFSKEGYAMLRCGGTSVRLTYTDLNLICGWVAVGSAMASDLVAQKSSALLSAIQSIVCEAALGRQA